MTSQKFLRKPSGVSPFSFFRFSLRQNWPAFMTSAVLFAIVNLILPYMSFADTKRSEFHVSHLENLAQGIMFINVVVASLLAVLWGCASLNYINSKVGVQFYHSLPLTRGKLYTTEILTKLVCLAGPLFLTSTLSVVILGVMSGIWSMQYIGYYLIGFGLAVLYYFFFLSVVFFAASFTGTVFARLIASGLVVFVPAALVIFVSVILNYHAVYTNYSLLTEYAMYLFMPLRAIQLCTDILHPEALVGREIFLTALAGCAFFAAGGFIYRYRKSELSGTPVLSRIAAQIIKYICMFCAACLSGIVFDAFMNSALWFCVGALIGALLAMMLMNTILTKSSRRMFSGMPAYGIFCAAFVAFFFVFGVDIIGHDTHIPSATTISSVTVIIDGRRIEILDKDEQNAILDEFRDWMDAQNTPNGMTKFMHSYLDVPLDSTSGSVEIAEATPDKYVLTEAVTYDGDLPQGKIRAINHAKGRIQRKLNITLNYNTLLGIPIQKSIRPEAADVRELLTLIAESENFVNSYFQDPERIPIRESYCSLGYYGTYVNEKQISSNEYIRYLREMREEYNGIDYFQRPFLTSIRYDGIYDSEDGSVNYYTYYPLYNASGSHYEASLANIIEINVINFETGKRTIYTDAADIRAICESSVVADGSFPFAMANVDRRYGIVMVVRDGTVIEDKNLKDIYEYSDEYITSAFLAGKIPAFVE